MTDPLPENERAELELDRALISNVWAIYRRKPERAKTVLRKMLGLDETVMDEKTLDNAIEIALKS